MSTRVRAGPDVAPADLNRSYLEGAVHMTSTRYARSAVHVRPHRCPVTEPCGQLYLLALPGHERERGRNVRASWSCCLRRAVSCNPQERL